MPRDPDFGPLPAELWPDQLQDMQSGFASSLNVYKVMAHHPDLLESWSDLRSHVVTRSSLGPERLEVVILRVAARIGAAYEWSHHVDRAEKIGMTRTRIRSIAGDPAKMSPDDAVLALAVDQLIDHARLQPETRLAVQSLAGKPGVLDLMATVGFYLTLGFIVKSMDIPLDDGISPDPLPTD